MLGMGTHGHVGAQIRRRRKTKGMTQAELAEAVGVTVESISRAERGTIQPTVATLGHIAQALGTSIDALAGATEPTLGEASAARSKAPAELVRLERLLRKLDQRALKRVLGLVEMLVEVGARKPRKRR